MLLNRLILLTFLLFNNKIFLERKWKHMKILKKFLCLFVLVSIALTTIACNSVDNKSTENTPVTDQKPSNLSEHESAIISSDRVMSQYFDISVFDEEDYENFGYEMYLYEHNKYINNMIRLILESCYSGRDINSAMEDISYIFYKRYSLWKITKRKESF